MKFLNDINITVVGLGYVGYPLAYELSKKYNVIGYDINENIINKYKNINNKIHFTNKIDDIKNSTMYIIAVPTPVDENNLPDNTLINSACKTVGEVLTKNNIVVFESTVYPGMTEEYCIPILEDESKLKCGKDFKVAFSPERINPGDNIHTLKNIKKIVAGIDDETTDIVSKIYGQIIDAGIYKVNNIKIAETSKIIENCQRDINIAFINEMAIFCKKIGIDINEVLDAAKTKWNFLDFRPGLVGGHCIGVDPYYLLYKAENINCNLNLLSTSRSINENMSKYVADNIIRILNTNKKNKYKVLIFGVTFKENCSDIRNSKVFDIIDILNDNNIETIIYDNYVCENDIPHKYKKMFLPINNINVDAVVFTVSHDEFRKFNISEIDNYFDSNQKIIFDIKHIFSKYEFENNNYIYWSL